MLEDLLSVYRFLCTVLSNKCHTVTFVIEWTYIVQGGTAIQGLRLCGGPKFAIFH